MTRFLALCRAAETDPGSFYRMFGDLDDDGRRAVAESTWDTINGVNLAEDIGPTLARAHVVGEKGPGHAVNEVRRQEPAR
ncbi:MAG: hypothetical protein ACR2H3_13320 [Acidimicrobiales bacterium]